MPGPGRTHRRGRPILAAPPRLSGLRLAQITYECVASAGEGASSDRSFGQKLACGNDVPFRLQLLRLSFSRSLGGTGETLRSLAENDSSWTRARTILPSLTVPTL
jgi:hypothetical protein